MISEISQFDTRKVSVLFFTYNHERFIESALRSALSQTLSGYELIISDDFSTDSTRDVIESVLQENVRNDVIIKKNYHDKNIGLIATFNEATALAKGEVFVLMSGDDISKPYRLEKTIKIFQRSPDVQLLWGEVIKIDAKGEILLVPKNIFKQRQFNYSSLSTKIYGGSRPCGASAAFRRTLYDTFGPMGNGSHGEDNCYWVRGLLLGKIHFEAEHFIYWRIHDSSISNYGAGSSDEVWRHRHLVWMAKHESMARQWVEDINKAHKLGFINWVAKVRLVFSAYREDATWRLGVSSLRIDPWTIWATKAVRLLFLLRLATVFKLFKTRLFLKRREKTWVFWRKLKSELV